MTASDPPPPTEPIPPQAKPEPGPSTYRTPQQVLDLVSSASIAPPPPAQDPDVALRHPAAGETMPTLSEYRASEGDARRLTRLRSLFDSLPPPNANITPDAPTPSATTATDADQYWKTYMRELWGQCGSSPTPPTPQQTQTADAQHKTTPRQPSPPSTASRWQAFEQYADLKERELWRAFCELDRDGDMRLRKSEVREACRRAGIELREDALDEFVRTVDRDGDGAISFDDWRDFLLLLPRPISMKEIWRYWQTKRLERPSMSRLTQDGDVTVVVGRGKSGWRRLFSRSSASTKPSPSTTTATPPPHTTDLRKLEPVNDEQHYMTACARRRAAEHECERKRESASAVSHAGHASPSLEFEETGVVAADPAREHHHHHHHKIRTPETPTREETGTTPMAEEEEPELDATHDMFADAGKFLLAGGMAGAVSRTATAPFDRLKVYLITSPASTTTATDASGKRQRPGRGSLIEAVRTVYRTGGGVKAFWTGNGLNIVKIFPESAIKFLSYESAKRVFAQYWDKVPDQTMISNSSRFVAGGIGGVISQFCIYPIEALKTRVMSSSGGQARGNALILQTARDMWSRGRFRYFFRGLPAGLIGVFPYSAIDMSTFEGIKLAYTQWAGEEPGVAGSLAFGAISGGVGASSVYPLNLVRTRLQAQGTPAHPQTYLGVRDAAWKCYQLEGWRGFYKGLTPTLVKVVPAVAISYAVYDTSKKMLFETDDQPCPEVSSDSEES